jgi:hypothetical protein
LSPYILVPTVLIFWPIFQTKNILHVTARHLHALFFPLCFFMVMHDYKCVTHCLSVTVLVQQLHFVFLDQVLLLSICFPLFVRHKISFCILFSRSSLVWKRSRLVWMRPSLVVRASDCQCQRRNSPGFDPSILRHSGI